MILSRLIVHIVTLPIVAFATSITATANSETREYFKDWLAACRTETGYCSTVTYVNPNPGNGSVADYWLRVGRPKGANHWEVSVTTIKEQPTLTSYFYFEVGEESYGFTRGVSAVAYGAVNDFFLVGDEANGLLTQMLAGSTAVLDFEHGKQPRERVNFSLSGLTAAMLWIDDQQGRVGDPRTVGYAPLNLEIAEPKLDLPGTIPEALLAQHVADPNCEPLQSLPHGEDWEVHQVSNDRLLYAIPCNAGAYNFSHAYYTQDLGYDEFRKLLFADYWDSVGWTGTDVLINSYFDPQARTLSSFYKGRGLGDCGTSGLWRWTGYSFKLVTFHAKSTCDGWEDGDGVGEFPQIYPPVK